MSSNSRYQKGIASSTKNEPKGTEAGMMRIAYRGKANMDEVIHII